MGATNAPAHFQRVMDLALAGLNWSICLVYLDDVLVFGRTWSEHMERLDAVLQRFKDANILLKFGKCEFFQRELTFLGHVISPEGIRPDPSKVSAVRECEAPKNVKELRRFIGMVNYFRRFIHHFADRAEPLLCMMRGGIKWNWGAAQQKAFEDLKECLVSPPVMQYPNREKPYILHADASKVATGAVLLQRDASGNFVVIAYHSKTLTDAERRYDTGERELLAITDAVKTWRRYLYGAQFEAWTDHEPLPGVLGSIHSRKVIDSPRLARLAQKLAPYLPEMTVKWVKGAKNVIADALSRTPFARLRVATSQASDVATQEYSPLEEADMRTLQGADPDLRALRDFLLSKKTRGFFFYFGHVQNVHTVPNDQHANRPAACHLVHHVVLFFWLFVRLLSLVLLLLLAWSQCVPLLLPDAAQHWSVELLEALLANIHRVRSIRKGALGIRDHNEQKRKWTATALVKFRIELVLPFATSQAPSLLALNEDSECVHVCRLLLVRLAKLCRRRLNEPQQQQRVGAC